MIALYVLFIVFAAHWSYEKIFLNINTSRYQYLSKVFIRTEHLFTYVPFMITNYWMCHGECFDLTLKGLPSISIHLWTLRISNDIIDNLKIEDF